MFSQVCCLGCERRDYTGDCPDGWAAVGSQCQAPLSYGGPCLASNELRDYNDIMKQQFEEKCIVQWPCVDSCVPDYSKTCPLKWVDMGSGVCEAPSTYSRQCLKRVRMLNAIFKRSFATECAVNWPCQKLCEEDFGQPCPKDWAKFEGTCEANPSSYVGPCAPFANLEGLSLQDKVQYAALCEVEFPCQVNVPAAPGAECEPTDAPCPQGWLRKGTKNGVCHGVHYRGPCRPVILISELVMIGNAKFMEMCGVDWECKDNSMAAAAPTAETSEVVHSGPVDVDGRIIASNV